MEKVGMLHIAIRIDPKMSYEEIAAMFREFGIAATTQTELKERIKDRLSKYPYEKWLCLSGNTIAEIESPTVSYRQY